MGRITERVTVKNYGDILKYREKSAPESGARAVEIEAIVDTGAAYLCLPPESISRLGLVHSGTKGVITANGKITCRIFSMASITIQGREIRMDVMENQPGTPPLIGYLVLETMDLVVDPGSQTVTGNPEHDYKWVMDMYCKAG